jgi:hypothetical protein
MFTLCDSMVLRTGREGDRAPAHYAISNTIPVQQTQAHFKSSTWCVFVHVINEFPFISGLTIRSIYVWFCSPVVQVSGLMFSGYGVA